MSPQWYVHIPTTGWMMEYFSEGSDMSEMEAYGYASGVVLCSVAGITISLHLAHITALAEVFHHPTCCGDMHIPLWGHSIKKPFTTQNTQVIKNVLSLTHAQWLGDSESTLFEKGEESKKGVLLAKTSQQCPSKAFSPFSIP